VANPISVHLGGANLGDTVLDNLKPDAPAQSFISSTLNTTLTSSLTTAATSAGYANLATLIQAIPPVDIIASKDLSLHDFVSKEVKFPDDPRRRPPRKPLSPSSPPRRPSLICSI
jgi:hypothetical protein